MDGVEDDLEQGFSRLSDGCLRWECQKWEPGANKPIHPQFVDHNGYWVCPVCKGYYGIVVPNAK